VSACRAVGIQEAREKWNRRDSRDTSELYKLLSLLGFCCLFLYVDILSNKITDLSMVYAIP
jgi:hypothetical protein